MPRIRSSVAAVALVVVAAVACDDATGPASDPATPDQVLAELSNPALASAGPTFVDIGDFVPSLDPAACPYSADSQKFVCPTVTRRGVTLRQSFTLLTASGSKQSAFDPASTDSVRASTDVDGTLVEQGTNVRVYGQQEVTLSGLASGPHLLDGFSSIVVAGTIADGTSTYPVNVRVNTSIYRLVLPARPAGSAPVWPSSGRITVDVSGTVAPASLNFAETVIEFSGSSIVDVTEKGAGGLAGAVGCTVDLAVAKPVCD
jgi:hypothetical protein